MDAYAATRYGTNQALAVYGKGQGLPSGPIRHRSLDLLRIVESQHLGRVEEPFDGFRDLGDQRAPANRQAEIDILSFQVGAFKRVLERSEDRARHEVVSLPWVKQVTVEKWLKQLFEFDRTQLRRLEVQDLVVGQGALIESGISLDESCAFFLVTTEAPQTGDLPAQSHFQ